MFTLLIYEYTMFPILSNIRIFYPEGIQFQSITFSSQYCILQKTVPLFMKYIRSFWAIGIVTHKRIRSKSEKKSFITLNAIDTQVRQYYASKSSTNIPLFTEEYIQAITTY